MLLDFLRETPALYAQSPDPFWDDEHISEQMLASHIAPDTDGASRPLAFIRRSVDWMDSLCGGGAGKKLLDLGCGPGIYDELLAQKGFAVTGIDLSRRSIRYAQEQAARSGSGVCYRCGSYLDEDFGQGFDVCILVYCDFGVLSPANRALVLGKALRALKPGGLLLLDAWTSVYLRAYEEKQTIRYENGGFWSAEPYVQVERDRIYPETANTLEQVLIVTETDCRQYYIWNQIFSPESLAQEAQRAGFDRCAFYDDIAGAPFTGKAQTLCLAARRPDAAQ